MSSWLCQIGLASALIAVADVDLVLRTAERFGFPIERADERLVTLTKEGQQSARD